ncbi:hypothetical protein PCK2_000924, partial [Pneumocystis canis]
MTHNTYINLNTLLHDPKLFLKPSNNLYSIVLFQVKMLLDPIIKQNCIFDQLYINGLDNNQIFEEVKLITDELVNKLLEELNFPSENQVKLQKKEYKAKKENIINKNTNNSLKHIEENYKKNQIILDNSKNHTLQINHNYVLKKNRSLIEKENVELNNSPFYIKNFNNTLDLKETNIFTNENKTFKETEYLLNSNNIKIDETCSDEKNENTNEIRYADFFLPSITKPTFKHEKISNLKEISEENNDTSEENNIGEIRENILLNVQQDLFENDIHEMIKKHKTLDKSEYTRTQEIL